MERDDLAPEVLALARLVQAALVREKMRGERWARGDADRMTRLAKEDAIDFELEVRTTKKLLAEMRTETILVVRDAERARAYAANIGYHVMRALLAANLLEVDDDA